MLRVASILITDGITQRTVDLVDAITVAGRAPENTLVIDDIQASRRHFQIEKTELGYKVVDLESRNGTRVNDRQSNLALLRPGDRIQVGKYVCTFEDPDFKEPPPILAALPLVAASLPMAPRPDTIPDPEARGRRPTRTSPTTTKVSLVQTEFHKEQQLLKRVAVGAGVFIALLVLLIFLPSGESTPSDPKTAPVMPVAKPSENEKLPSGVTDTEKRDFDDLNAFFEKNRNDPTMMDPLWTKCEDYRKIHPRSLLLARVNDIQRIAIEKRDTARRGALTEIERLAEADLRKNEFGAGLKRMQAVLAQYNDDIEARDRIVTFLDDILDKAKAHFQSKRAEADTLATTNRKLEAKLIFQTLIENMGDGKIPELDLYCKIARSALDAIR